MAVACPLIHNDVVLIIFWTLLIPVFTLVNFDCRGSLLAATFIRALIHLLVSAILKILMNYVYVFSHHKSELCAFLRNVDK